MIRVDVRVLTYLITIFTLVLQMSVQANSRSLKTIGNEFSEVLKYTDANMWAEAANKVDVLKNSVAFDILLWLKLRAGTHDFSEYESFLLVNHDWPGIRLLRLKGELAIDSSIKPTRILNYFSNHKPLTANGSLKLAKAFLAEQEYEKAQNVMTESWLDHPYSNEEFKEAMALFGPFLKKYNVERITNLLWLGMVKQAEDMLPFVPKTIKQLSRVRIALQTKSFGVDSLLRDLPKNLRDNSGLIFDRFSYRQAKNLHEGAETLLIEASQSTETLGKPNFWLKGRAKYARRALQRGDYEKAYIIVSRHFVDLSDKKFSKEAAELEWLAGFIAFEFLQKYQRALTHFTLFSQSVINPINQAKASYWIGRSHEKLGEHKKMMANFAVGARYQTTFYGQLSAERGNFPADATLVSSSERHDWENAEFINNANVKSGILLYYSGRSVLADRFFNHTSENLRKIDRLRLSQLTSDLGLSASGFSISKTAGQAGLFCPNFSFPMIEKDLLIDQELASLVSAIIRQESGFFPYTKSPSGAIGLMQVMPPTAASMAKKLGLGFSQQKLLNDKKYNIKIGTYFLKTLLKKFDESRVLSIAAYNAGPSRIEDWINKFGDPRNKGIDPVVWIEMIPFVETRNYVKRVMEADWVYKGKFDGKPAALNIGRKSFGHKF